MVRSVASLSDRISVRLAIGLCLTIVSHSSRYCRAQDIGRANELLQHAIDDADTPRRNAVVRLMPGGPASGCTGTLIAKDLVLTAGHCVDHGLYKLQNKHSGRFLTGTDDADVVQWNDVGQPSLLWRPVSVRNGKDYWLKNLTSGKFLAVDAPRGRTGADVVQWDEDGRRDTQWTPEYAGNGYYKFRNKKSGKYLAVSGGHLRTGADIIQWTDDGQQDILWRPIHVGDNNTPNSGITIFDGFNWELPSHWYDIEGGGIPIGFGVDRSGVAADSGSVGTDETFVLRGGRGAVQHNMAVRLQTSMRRYLVAEKGGGTFVGADRKGAGKWETFIIERVEGAGTIRDGDQIALRANNGQYVVAENGGGGVVNANRTRRGPWETFVIERQNGSGALSYGDRIALRAQNGQYLVANNGGAGDFLAIAVEYSIAGNADIIVLRLDREVPPSVAVPMPVMTRIDGDESARDDIRRALRGRTFRMVGYGDGDPSVPLARLRQTAAATFKSYPAGGQRTKMLVEGVATPRHGDSGSPLLWTNPITGREMVVGVNQGFSGDDGRYTLTFYGGSNDGKRPNIAIWLEDILGTEDCIGLNPDDLEVRRLGLRWVLAAGSSLIADFGTSEREARRARQIIRHYGITAECYIERPDSDFSYYTVEQEVPQGAMADEDCIRFDPSTLGMEPVDDGWVLTDASGLQFALFGPSGEAGANEAQVAIRLLRVLGADRICFVGRPDPSMTYFRR